MKELLLCLLIGASGISFVSAAEQELCNPVTYNALSVDLAYDVLPDELDDSRLPACARWVRVTSGNADILVMADTDAHNGKAAKITDHSHAERLIFRYAVDNPEKITARLKVEPPGGAPEFLGSTLGVFMEIDDGLNRIYMNLLNQDFAGGADPEVGIAGAGALDQYGTYVTRTVYWDDGAYHIFELSRNNDGSGTLVVDGDSVNAVHVPAVALQPTSGFTGFRFGAVASGISEAYWDEVLLESGGPQRYLGCLGFFPPMHTGETGKPVKVKKNRVLPLKAQLLDEFGSEYMDADLATPPVLQVTKTTATVAATDVTSGALAAGQGTDGNEFYFEYDDEQWHYNLKTRNYTSPGLYTVWMESGDTNEYIIDPTCIAEFMVQ